MKNAEPEPVDVEVTPAESAALQGAWDNLGPLMAFAIQKLGREDGLKVCNGLRSRDLLPVWTLRPGLATCTIWQDSEIIYKFEFEHHPPRFEFAEITGTVN